MPSRPLQLVMGEVCDSVLRMRLLNTTSSLNPNGRPWPTKGGSILNEKHRSGTIRDGFRRNLWSAELRLVIERLGGVDDVDLERRHLSRSTIANVQAISE